MSSFIMKVHVMKLVEVDGEEEDVEMVVNVVELDDNGLWIYVQNTQHWTEIRTWDGRKAFFDKEEYDEHVRDLNEPIAEGIKAEMDKSVLHGEGTPLKELKE